jgi:chromosome transmission fidelity protein 1
MSPVCRLTGHSPSFSDYLSQISDVVAQLFSHLPQDRLSNFSCGHIIPSSNLQALVVSKGPRGSDLEFKFDRRGDKLMVSPASCLLLR